jgi:uncharacterized protein YcfL
MKKILTPVVIAALCSVLSGSVEASGNSAKSQTALPQISSDSILMHQTQSKAIDMGELGYDFVAVSEPQAVTINHRDAFGQNNPMTAIQFIVQARQFVTPLGYLAYFYDADGIEVGFTPVEMSPPGGSYQPNQRIRVTIPIILPDPNAQVQNIVIRRL